MKQYIDKAAVVAEIENKIAKYTKRGEESDAKRDGYGMYWGGVLSCLNGVRSFLDTLKVKEVDVKKEAELIANGIMIGVQANKYHTNVYNTNRNDFNHSHLLRAAMNGIELGLAVSNPTTAADRGMAEEIIINLKRLEKDYRIDLTKEMEWLRQITKKGE